MVRANAAWQRSRDAVVKAFLTDLDRLCADAAALHADTRVVVKGCAGIGKRALLRQVRARLQGERTCLWHVMAIPTALVNDLAEQVHQQLGLVVPERFILAVCRDAADLLAAVYWNMTPLLSIAVIALMAVRFFSRGIGETELLVLLGVGSAVFWRLIVLARRLGR